MTHIFHNYFFFFKYCFSLNHRILKSTTLGGLRRTALISRMLTVHHAGVASDKPLLGALRSSAAINGRLVVDVLEESACRCLLQLQTKRKGGSKAFRREESERPVGQGF